MNANAETEPLFSRPLTKEPPEIRAGFISKVYGILCVQLLVTAAVAAPFVLNDGAKQFVKHHGFPLVIGAIILNCLFLCFLMCPCGCEKNMRTYPTNYLLLGGFTVTEGLLVGICCAQYTVGSVLFAVVATGVLVGALTAYAMYTKTDFTGMGPYLFAAMIVLMFFGFFCMFIGGPFLHKVYCCIGILVFSFYLIFDTQLMMGNGELSLGIDDYVFAAINLYLDIINLFLFILQLFGDRN